jgi:hypothetical protein
MGLTITSKIWVRMGHDRALAAPRYSVPVMSFRHPPPRRAVAQAPRAKPRDLLVAYRPPTEVR